MRVVPCLVLVLALVAPLVAGELELDIRVGGIPAGMDPAKAAALAEWNSPMGRLTFFLNEQQASLLRGGLPGASAAPVLRLKVQSGLPPQLVGAAVDAGVEQAQARLTVIPWPWDEDAVRESRPLSDQLTALLGQRLRPTDGP